jgi:dihydroxy-acid dehydratase
LGLLETGDRVRIDLSKGTANILVPKTELTRRRAVLERAGGYQVPNSQTPWQEMHRASVEQLSEGMVLKAAVKYQRIAQKTTPRDSH